MSGIVNSTGAVSGIIGTTVGTPSASGALIKTQMHNHGTSVSSTSAVAWADITDSDFSYTPASSTSTIVIHSETVTTYQIPAGISYGYVRTRIRCVGDGITNNDSHASNALRRVDAAYFEGAVFQPGQMVVPSTSTDAITIKMQWAFLTPYAASGSISGGINVWGDDRSFIWVYEYDGAVTNSITTG